MSPLATKPAGAYRPPGARGLATPTIFKREDEGGVAQTPSNGISNPPSRTGTPANGRYVPGAGRRQRAVPGAPPPGSPTPQEEGKKNKKKKGKKDGGGDASADNVALPTEVPPPVTVVAAPPIQAPVPETPGAEGGLDPVAKKIRNLNKKVRFGLLFDTISDFVSDLSLVDSFDYQLKAIDELKERVQRGDKLEATQLKKIEGEADIRKELKSLGAPA